jgi:hypothetical protein
MEQQRTTYKQLMPEERMVIARPPSTVSRELGRYLVPRSATRWEGDFIKGAGNKSSVGVLVERTSRLVLSARMEDATAAAALAGFTVTLNSIAVPMRQSLTYAGRWMLLLSVFATDAVLAQVPRHDVLECALPHRGSVVLTSRYLWLPMNPNPGSAKTREPNEPFEIRIKIDAKASAITSSGTLGGKTLKSADQARRLCALFGAFEGNVYTPFEVIRRKDGRSFEWTRLKPPSIEVIEMHRTPEERALLHQADVRPSDDSAQLIRADGIWVNEQALYTNDFTTIKAVYRSESKDEGKTWSEGSIRQDAEIFEIGKPLEEQPFVADPIRLNHKAVE